MTSTITKFKTPKSERTFENVLSTATELFRTKGFHGTTMRDISKAANLGLGALYYYFRTKEELVIFFYQRVNQQIFADYEAATPAGKMPERFRQFMQTKLQVLVPHRSLLYVVLQEGINPESTLSPLNAASRETLQSNLAFFERTIIDDPKGASGDAAKLLWLLHMGLIFFWLYDKSESFVQTNRILDTTVQVLHFMEKLTVVPGFAKLSGQIFSSMNAIIPGGNS